MGTQDRDRETDDLYTLEVRAEEHRRYRDDADILDDPGEYHRNPARYSQEIPGLFS